MNTVVPTAPPTVESLAAEVLHLQERVRTLEDTLAIRDVVLRYMNLCDHLDAHTPMDMLGDCFTEDAVWAGSGARYRASFGSHEGRQAILAMLGRYRGGDGAPPHFRFNAHFLCNEQIHLHSPHSAQAAWQMLQTSSFHAGGSHLTAAQLTLHMRKEADGRWRIARFQTENLLSRPVSTWHAEAALPVPSAAD